MNGFKLDNHPKIKPGFTVPEGYFENFGSDLMQRIHAEPKVIPLRSRKSWIYAVAAVLIVALAIPAINTFTASERTDTAIDTYLATVNIPEEQIVELLDAEDIEALKVDYLADAQIEEALTDSEIETYLLY